MSDLRFLYRSAPGLLLAWFSLAVLSALLELAAINSILPMVWESNSAVKDFVRNGYALLGFEAEPAIGVIISFVAAAYVLRNACLTLQGAVAARIATAVRVAAKLRLLGGLEGASYYPLSRMNAGVLDNAIHRESDNMSLAIGNLINAASQGMFATALLILAMTLEPLLIAAAASVLLPCYFGMKRVIGFSNRISVEITRNDGRIQSLLAQLLSALQYLKNTQSFGRIADIARTDIRRQGQLRFVQQCFAHSLHHGTDLILVLLVLGGLFVYVVPLGKPAIGILFILFVLRRSMSYAMSCQVAFRQYLESHGSVDIVQRMDRDLSEYEAAVRPGAIPPDLSQPIRLEGVSFRYPASAPVLGNVSLTIPPGSRVAIVGASGAGKSTLLMLLTGALQPTGGRICLGGTLYDELDLARLRSQIGYVSQENPVFNDTVINNVTLWDPEPDLARFEGSLASAGAGDFVQELPQRENTPLGDGGNALSSGQRQRISIARELYKKGRILILDEATSALDGGAEACILDNIRSAVADATVIAVTHRIAATRLFDRIYVLEKGTLVEQGAYDELHRAGGAFRRMADHQGL